MGGKKKKNIAQTAVVIMAAKDKDILRSVK